MAGGKSILKSRCTYSNRSLVPLRLWNSVRALLSCFVIVVVLIVVVLIVASNFRNREDRNLNGVADADVLVGNRICVKPVRRLSNLRWLNLDWSIISYYAPTHHENDG